MVFYIIIYLYKHEQPYFLQSQVVRQLAFADRILLNKTDLGVLICWLFKYNLVCQCMIEVCMFHILSHCLSRFSFSSHAFISDGMFHIQWIRLRICLVWLESYKGLMLWLRFTPPFVLKLTSQRYWILGYTRIFSKELHNITKWFCFLFFSTDIPFSIFLLYIQSLWCSFSPTFRHFVVIPCKYTYTCRVHAFGRRPSWMYLAVYWKSPVEQTRYT